MQLFTNNATSKLVAGISNVSLSLQVSAGDGAKFPNPTGGDYFLATLSRVTSGIESNVEIVKVTARATDVFTIIRAQEGTSALVYLENDFVQLRMTAATATANEAHLNNVSNPHTVTKTQVGLGSADNTADADKPVSTAQATAIGLKIDTAAKDATGGVPGLTLFKLNMRNAANTITSWFTNAATVARTWTLPDKDGTVAMLSDITGTNSGTNTGDNAVNTLYSGLVTNATHTGDATGSTALTVVKINGVALSGLASGLVKNTTGTGVPSIAAAGTDYVAPVGSDTAVTRQMFKDCGLVFLDKGNSGTSTQTLDFTAGSHQKITATGNHTIATSNWPPTGNLGDMLLELTNGGAYTITWPTINWRKPDGTFTTSISTYLAANTGRVALQSSGTDFIVLWSRDAGTTIYGSLV